MNARIMRSFGTEESEYKTYAKAIDSAYEVGKKKSIAYGYFAGGAMFIANAVILIIVYYGAVLVIRNEMSIGNLTTFVFYTAYIAMGLGMISSVYSEAMNAVGASTR